MVARSNVCGFNRSKKTLREFVASRAEFRKFSRSKVSTARRQLARKHFQLPSSKQSSEYEDREREYKKHRFVMEQNKFNQKLTKYTSDLSQPDFTCRAKTRPTCFNPKKQKCESSKERTNQQCVKLNSQASSKPMEAKYEKSLQRFIKNTKTNQKKDNSSKLTEFVPMSMACCKQKFVSKVRHINNR